MKLPGIVHNAKIQFTIIDVITGVVSGVRLHLHTQEIFVLNLKNQSLDILDTISDHFHA
jgi:hypothetical protein